MAVVATPGLRVAGRARERGTATAVVQVMLRLRRTLDLHRPPTATPARAERALDVLNLALSDVRYGLGACLGVHLLAEHGWDEAGIGLASVAAVSAVPERAIDRDLARGLSYPGFDRLCRKPHG